MQWICHTKQEVKERQEYITKLLRKKHLEIEQLNFEIGALTYIYNTIENQQKG